MAGQRGKCGKGSEVKFLAERQLKMSKGRSVWLSAWLEGLQRAKDDGKCFTEEVSSETDKRVKRVLFTRFQMCGCMFVWAHMRVYACGGQRTHSNAAHQFSTRTFSLTWSSLTMRRGCLSSKP